MQARSLRCVNRWARQFGLTTWAPLKQCQASARRSVGRLRGGDLNTGERHSRDTRDDGTVTLCTLCAATVLSRDCRADFGRPLTKKVMSHSRDGPDRVSRHHRGQTLYLSQGVGIPPPPSVIHPKKVPDSRLFWAILGCKTKPRPNDIFNNCQILTPTPTPRPHPLNIH